MKISELGEFGLIELLAGLTEAARDGDSDAWRQLVIGIGDDAAAWNADDAVQLATTDFLVQDVHFSLEYTGWAELGWRSLAANLSDIAAMGGLPRYALVSLALPGETESEDILAFYGGMLLLAKKYGVAIVGGDTSAAPIAVVSITVLGSTGGPFDRVLTRSAAKPGDRVAVTGSLGGSAGGLEMLSKRLKVPPADEKTLREAFLKPVPRVAEGTLLAEHGVKAAIDVSDGLLKDLGHICEMSGVGARVEAEAVPVNPAVTRNFSERALAMALGGGEDYELLFTAPLGLIEQIKREADCPVTVIGEITADNAGEVTLVDGRGNPLSLPEKGWEHFRPHRQ